MRLYEYLIGGKKTGRIGDLKDPMSDSKPFCGLKEGETFFISQFKPNGTCVYTAEVEITSIDKKPTRWIFSGFTKEGEDHAYFVWTKDLDKKLEVRDQRTCYMAYSTFKMDDGPFFKLIKKEIKNSKK